jgi:NO-binding membrane sensor protein with MHYT domain
MTALSLFVPLIATVFAFWFIGYEMEIPLWRIVISGVFVGLTSESCSEGIRRYTLIPTVSLMHYSASFQLPYLNVSYSAVTVVFALILASAAATAAFFAFFKFRAQWSDSFWKRGLCSLFLAAAVCG